MVSCRLSGRPGMGKCRSMKIWCGLQALHRINKGGSMVRKATLFLAGVATLTNVLIAQAQQNWPQRPITLIVPSSPGGMVDTLGRTLADGLSTYLGQTVVVENRSGATGTIGLQAALRAPDDGYTYVIAYPSIVINTQFTFKDLPFNAKRDFQAVSGIAYSELVMSVNAAVPATNPRELVEWMKQQPGNMAYGSYGLGTGGHIAGNYLGALYGINAVHVPYKGEQPMLMAMASSDIVYGIGTFAPAKTVQDSGKIRIIGVLAAERSRFYPDLPTFKELGMDDPALQLGGWFGLFTRKSVPAPIVKKMEEAVHATLRTPLMQERLSTLSVAPWGVSSRDFEERWFKEIPVYHNLLRLAGVEIYE